MARTKTPTFPCFTALDEANTALSEIGSLERAIAKCESVLADKIAELRKRSDETIAPLAQAMHRQVLALNAYADAHRATLLSDGKKTVMLTAGNFGWRFTPPKVYPGKGGDKKLLEKLKELELTQFIRTKEEPDKEAMLKEKPAISGVKYLQKEEFFVEPASAVDPDKVIYFAKASA